MGEESSEGIVYILTNPAMPGLVKIGKTSRDSVKERLKELYSSTGVPVPFECEYAARVEDASAVEQILHETFGPYRINPKREFFDISSEEARDVLQPLGTEDVTPEIQSKANGVDVESRPGAERLRSRRPNLDFHKMEIPPGAELKFTRADESVEVICNKRVRYQGETYSLSQITRKLLGTQKKVHPAPYWTYKGKSLREIYDETY